MGFNSDSKMSDLCYNVSDISFFLAYLERKSETIHGVLVSFPGALRHTVPISPSLLREAKLYPGSSARGSYTTQILPILLVVSLFAEA